MTETERWGIKGLQALLDGAYGADQAALAHGMDLNMLGLDFNRSDMLQLILKVVADCVLVSNLYTPIGLDHSLTLMDALSFLISPFQPHTLFIMFHPYTKR